MKSQRNGKTWISKNKHYSITQTLKENDTAIITPHKISRITEDSNHKMDEIQKQWNYQELSKSARIASAATLIIAEIIGIIGNLFALILITRILKYRRNIPNILICLLTIVDLMALPMTYSQAILSHIEGRYLGGQLACTYHATAITLFKYLSIVLISLISLERFIAMSYPFCYKERISYDETRKHKIAIVLILVLIAVAIISLLPVIGVGHNVLQYPNSYCSFDMSHKMKSNVVLLAIHITFLSSIAILVIVSNIGVCIQAHKLIQKIRPSLQISKREVQKSRSLSPSQSGVKKTGLKKLTPRQEKKLLKISIFNIAIFIVCWFPFLVKMFLSAIGVRFYEGLDFAAARLVSLQSVITPWMYPLFRRQYSSGFLHLFKTCISTLTFNLVKKPEMKLDDIVGARSHRKEALQFYSQQNRTRSRMEGTTGTNEFELQGLGQTESSITPQLSRLKTNPEASVSFAADEENANDKQSASNVEERTKDSD